MCQLDRPPLPKVHPRHRKVHQLCLRVAHQQQQRLLRLPQRLQPASRARRQPQARAPLPSRLHLNLLPNPHLPVRRQSPPQPPRRLRTQQANRLLRLPKAPQALLQQKCQALRKQRKPKLPPRKPLPLQAPLLGQNPQKLPSCQQREAKQEAQSSTQE